MATTLIRSLRGDNRVDLDDRGPIVDHLLTSCPDYHAGELEKLKAQMEHQERVLRAILLGCSKKDFRHTVQHFGLTVEND